MLKNPFKNFETKDWLLWLASLIAVTAVNLVAEKIDLLTLVATWVGVTSLILAAKRNVWSQILMVLFSVLYGIISWKVRYWGEMITYLGMTMPMAIWSTITWLKNPARGGKEVAIGRVNRRQVMALAVLTIVVTAVFFFILKFFDTPNLAFSTLSIATSFVAASLTIMRSPFFAMAYASNDVVLIILWSLAAISNPEYVPVIVNFAIFLINDMYGFFRWKASTNLLFQ